MHKNLQANATQVLQEKINESDEEDQKDQKDTKDSNDKSENSAVTSVGTLSDKQTRTSVLPAPALSISRATTRPNSSL